MSLMAKLSGIGTIKSSTLSESPFFDKKEHAPTNIPIINAVLSGEFNGGLTSGLTMIAGPSRHFKSNLGLTLVAAYMKKYDDAICLFYDAEFGITKEYIQAAGIDPDRVMHIPIVNIEELKFDLAQKLDEIKKGDKVIIFVDSVGNLASRKEAEDAKEGKGAADLTRAKELKSAFRIVTPHLTIKDIPCVVINHTYKEMALYPKDIVSGGTGGMLSSNTVWIVGRSQEKDGTDIVGYNFTINVEKSRFVKEKTKVQFTVRFDHGIDQWSGLFDLALECGIIENPKKGWYCLPGSEKNFRAADINNKEFWLPVLKDPKFQDYVRNKFKLHGHSVNQESFDNEE